MRLNLINCDHVIEESNETQTAQNIKFCCMPGQQRRGSSGRKIILMAPPSNISENFSTTLGGSTVPPNTVHDSA